MISPQEALERLREGNRRFAAGVQSSNLRVDPARRAGLARGQRPWAIVLGCSDSRVPVEMVFDQGIGDLFVLRVAGNVAAPSQVGSIELAAERFGTRLVVVLGHSHCGVISLTLEDLEHPAADMPAGLRSVVDLVRPSVEGLAAPGLGYDKDAVLQYAVRANVRASIDRLRHGSCLLERLAGEDGLVVVGAEYSLETGVVDFEDAWPPVNQGRG
jgi:carbonic anhydrase